MSKLHLPYNRRQFIKLTRLFSTAVGLSTIAGSCGKSFLSEAYRYSDRPVRVGYLPITDASPLLAAYDKGFYRGEGLDILPPQRYRSWGAIVDAFTKEEVNVIHVLMPTAIWVRYGMQFPGKVVAWNHTNGSAITVLPTIDRPEDLGGRTVAIPYWYSIHNIVLQALLRERGLQPTAKSLHLPLEPREVRLVVLPPPDMLSALSRGDIAGYIVAEPYNSAAETQGVGKVLRLTGDIWKDHACCVVFAREDDINDRPQWMQKVVNAIVKSQHWSRANRPELAHLLSLDGGGYIPHSVSVLERVLSSYDRDYYTQKGAIVHPQWRSRRIDFQPYPFPSYTRSLTQVLQRTFIQDDIDFLQQLSADFVVGDLVDDSFVKKALEQVGGPQAFGLPLNLSRSEQLETRAVIF
ncbi:MAG: ABC transporter substrate-binding protein [Cyanobacteria bacterium P01_E01_bin.42]